MLAWDPSPDVGVAGYNAYYGTASRNYVSIVPAGNATNIVITGLTEGATYYFAVTAYDALGVESDFSNEVLYSVPIGSTSNAPSISTIATQTIQENSALAPIGFVVGDPDTPATSLTLSAWSSNPSLVPAANVIFGGSGSNRTVQLTPVTDQFGYATIGIVVSDGTGNSAQTTFLLTVQSNVVVSLPPTIGFINGANIQQGTSTGDIPFVIGDPDTPVNMLTLSASSSYAALVPATNFVFGGTGSNRTIRITPAPDKFGLSTITVRVADNSGNSAATIFSLNVLSNTPARPPTISAIANQAIQVNTSTATLPIAIGDPDTAASSLTLSASSSLTSLVPISNIVFGGSGSNRTVRITPATNQTGTVTIGITVRDNTNSASTSFTLTVTNAPTPLPPTIAAIANQSIRTNTSTAALAFVIGDPDTPANSLTLSASSSLTSLVPLANIGFGGSGSNRTVTVTPAANQSGTATIDITVRDANSNSASTSFTLTVTNGITPLPPTIAAIANQFIRTNTSTAALAFVIGDPDTPASSLTLSASSSLTSLVPLSNIVFGGSGSNRTVTVTPAANQSGTATIDITVRDANSNSASTSFTLTVTNGITPLPPTIAAIANQFIRTNTATAALAFVIGDPDTPASSLTLSASSSLTSLVPLSNIVFGGSGSNRTVTVTPAANQSGTATIGITVRDPSNNTASTSFTLTVTNGITPLPPTIAAIANQSIRTNTSTAALAFVIGDPDTPASSLTLSASSSLTSLVPLSNIVFGGSGSNRTVTVTPAANQSGTATIGITVRDSNSNSASTSFTLLVTNAPVQQPPTISGIGNQTIALNSSTAALPFVIGDPDTAVGSLTLSASSSLTSLVPISNIIFGGSGSNRTVTVTPARNQTGSVRIGITVQDNSGNSALATFAIVVTNVPATQPPTISTIADQTIEPNSSTAKLPFVIGDPDTAATSLTLTATSSLTTLVPVTNIVFGGSGSNRTVIVTPKSGQAGQVTIGILVQDNSGNSASTFFLLNVQSNPPPTGLVLVTNGSGGITPNLKAQSLTVSRAYTLTAVPAPGQVFAGWSGAISSSAAKLKFTYSSNMVLQANFIPNPFTPISGSYNGLFSDSEGVQTTNSGFFTASLTAAGGYSGRLQLAGRAYPFSGKLNFQCRGTNTIKVGTNLLRLVFKAGATNGIASGKMAGDIAGNGWNAALQADRAGYNARSNPAPKAGTYVLMIHGDTTDSLKPYGHSFGSVKVNTSGLVNLVGTLSDGTKFSQSAPLSQDGMWPLFASLYKGKGILISWQTFDAHDDVDFYGHLVWIKAPDLKARLYPAGFDFEQDVFGSRYTPPTTPNAVLNATTAIVPFYGGNLPADFGNYIQLAPNGKVVNLSTNKFTMTFSLSTGTFSGTVADPVMNKSWSFNGAILQKQNEGYGFLTGTNRSSQVAVFPN